MATNPAEQPIEERRARDHRHYDRRDGTGGNPRSLASIAGHPIHPMLVPIPMACFIGALVTDLAYYSTLDFTWATFSVWLLAGGLVVAVFAAIAGAIDYFGNRRIRSIGMAKVHVIGNIVALILAIVNAFVHSRDGYTAVVPTGLTLSILTVLILGLTAWAGGSLVYRHGVGVAN